MIWAFLYRRDIKKPEHICERDTNLNLNWEKENGSNNLIISEVTHSQTPQLQLQNKPTMISEQFMTPHLSHFPTP
jgi:hypothetical protein